MNLMSEEEINGIIQLISSPDNTNRMLGIDLANSLNMSIDDISELCIKHFCRSPDIYNPDSEFDIEYTLGDYNLYGEFSNSKYVWITQISLNTDIEVLGPILDKFELQPCFKKLIKYYLNH